MPLQVKRRHSLQYRPFSNHVTNKRVPQTELSTHVKEEQALLPNTISLFDTLPIELQAEIFSHCLPPFPTFAIDEAPLSIARVCRAWNYLVFNTPKLWSAFQINIAGAGTPLSPSHMHTMKSTKQWLLRSKQCPLSIRVIHNPVGRSPDSRSRQLLALLMPEAHRWKDIELEVPSLNISTLQNTLPNDFPALQSMALRLKGPWGSSPSLDLSLRHIPWRQITCIDLQLEHPNLINLDGCLDILSQTERLKECALKLECTMGLLNVRHDIIVLPSLDSFTLNLHGGIKTQIDRPEACLAQFLNCISVPRLQTLHLGWFVPQNQESGLWTAHHSDFLAFICGSAATLRRLSLAYLPFSEEELQECLSPLPNITHLTLKYPLNDVYDDPVTSALLSACTFTSLEARNTHPTSSRDLPLLPMLEHCDIEGHGRGYTSGGLVTFIESRSRAKICQGSDASTQRGVMKSCHVFSTNAVLDEVEDYVRQWKNDGMEISIESLIIR